jgi:glycosyltransferase involved in cell wall biosynthesis
VERVSAVVITRNEERDIVRTLDALAFADEVLVVDSLSTDRTAEICAARGARVVSRPFHGYGAQKRFAVSLATHDWVLCVDADEVVDAELARAVRALLGAERPPPCDAYALSFRTVFMGRQLRRGAREVHVRLFDRRRAQWSDARVHEHVLTDGKVGTLPGLVLHESARDVAEAIEKLNLYTSRAALDLRARPSRGAAALLLSGAWHFFRHYVLKRQFLNGVPGFAWSMLFSVGSVVKRLKGHELAEHPAAAMPVPAPAPAPAPTRTRESSAA